MQSGNCLSLESVCDAILSLQLDCIINIVAVACYAIRYANALYNLVAPPLMRWLQAWVWHSINKYGSDGAGLKWLPVHKV